MAAGARGLYVCQMSSTTVLVKECVKKSDESAISPGDVHKRLTNNDGPCERWPGG